MCNNKLNKKELVDKQKRQNYITFINTTQQLLETNGIEQLSIRKIAHACNFHNSTIYLYFKDVNQLIMLASIKYLQEYSDILETQIKQDLSSTELLIQIWGSFFDATMENAQIFQNFFFGKRSNEISELMNLYYDLFPEERRIFPTYIEKMYYGQNITNRSLYLLQPLIEEEDNNVSSNNINLINDLIVSYFKYKIENKCQKTDFNNFVEKQDFLNAISYIIGYKKII